MGGVVANFLLPLEACVTTIILFGHPFSLHGGYSVALTMSDAEYSALNFSTLDTFI